MLTLFRKIRKTLIHGGKPTKYVLYAIGEIALVVIGILIALQINIWNEERKNKDWEKYYLERIIDDLQNDIKDIKSTLKGSYLRVLNGNMILTKLGENYLETHSDGFQPMALTFLEEAKKLFPEIELFISQRDNADLWQLNSIRRFTPRQFTYDELNSSGRLEIIRSDSLRESISNYYWLANDYSGIDKDLEFVQKSYTDFISAENIAIAEHNSFESIENRLKDVEGYKTVLKNLVYEHCRTRALYLFLMRRADKLIDQIELQSDLQQK